MDKAHSHRLRIGRYSEANRIYLITTCTRNRQPWFRRISLGREVVRALMREQYAQTLCFVVMPDHLHWLMQLTGGQPVARVVARIKATSGLSVRRLTGTEGSLWQQGFHDRAVRREDDVKGIARYVVANPLRAGMVNTIGEYPLWDAIWLR